MHQGHDNNIYNNNNNIFDCVNMISFPMNICALHNPGDVPALTFKSSLTKLRYSMMKHHIHTCRQS